MFMGPADTQAGASARVLPYREKVLLAVDEVALRQRQLARLLHGRRDAHAPRAPVCADRRGRELGARAVRRLLHGSG
jgi:hypothetical protein